MPVRIGVPSCSRRHGGVILGFTSLVSRIAVVHRRIPLSTTRTYRHKDDYLTVAVTPGAYNKTQVIETAHDYLATTSSGTPGNSKAAVVLASGGLISWLNDADFLAALLAPWRGANSEEMSILTAAVDGVKVQQHGSDLPATEGLAIMAGPDVDRLLPGLWEHDTTASSEQHDSREPPKAYIEFWLPPLPQDGRPLHVTLPLANTLFKNGRPHTMFASRLVTEPGAPAMLTDSVEKISQVVVPQRGLQYNSTVTAPLVAITKERKIVSGLGNILRQIEGSRQVVRPASTELEQYIPTLLKARSSPKRKVVAIGPLTVWAVIYPKELVEEKQVEKEIDGQVEVFTKRVIRLKGADRTGFNFPARHRAEKGGWISELAYSQEVTALMPQLLAGGCHIRKVLSGGGGWGEKQGLLSLDPENRYVAPDQEDVESFINSFKGEAGGIVSPGNFVQFMVQPGYQIEWETVAEREIYHSSHDFSVVSIGVKDESRVDLSPEDPSKMFVNLNHFGVTSSKGVFIASDKEQNRKRHESVIETKMDVPNTRVISTL